MIVAALRIEAVPVGATADWVADRLESLVAADSATTTGVYVATRDAGAAAALGFWQRALMQGVGVASPAGFPATLASSLGTHVALRFGLTGANHCLVGGDDASAGALDAAVWALADGSVTRAIVIRCDLGMGTGGHVAAVALVAGDRRCLYADITNQDDPIVALSRDRAPLYAAANA